MASARLRPMGMGQERNETARRSESGSGYWIQHPLRCLIRKKCAPSGHQRWVDVATNDSAARGWKERAGLVMDKKAGLAPGCYMGPFSAVVDSNLLLIYPRG